MRVLIACERSGIVREAFRKRGHEAYSCDLEPSRDNSRYHIQGDAIAASRQPWDLMIAHPECRYLCNSGALRLYRDGKKAHGRDGERWERMEEAARFFTRLMLAPIPRKAIENSIMHGHAKAAIAPYMLEWHRQIIQPHQFGEDASKATLLLLHNLPPLRATKAISPRFVDGKPRWENQTDGGQNRLGPSPERSEKRAQTYPGIAEAMAEQWGTCMAR